LKTQPECAWHIAAPIYGYCPAARSGTIAYMLDEDGDIKPASQFWELGVIAIAAVFTSCIIGLWFFSFKVPTEKPPTEITVGIGQGSTIQPAKPKP